VSWVKCGVDGARQILQAGANDLGGTLMDENISRAAGASHGQELDEMEFRRIVEPIGRTLAQRTTLYGRTTTVGKRLRPPDDHVAGDGGATPIVLSRRPATTST
jgi:FO synthase